MDPHHSQDPIESEPDADVGGRRLVDDRTNGAEFHDWCQRLQQSQIGGLRAVQHRFKAQTWGWGAPRNKVGLLSGFPRWVVGNANGCQDLRTEQLPSPTSVQTRYKCPVTVLIQDRLRL